eukprot:Plantae.Rhodophyta-Purpureofilum_apyrenoidigerum.ctg27174.p1 GENE.Plantae.Rhodophyta-Purpureofilum_apyrenoidigerum.ctg27174~~Plantae.Rhodophyta-Purpureofilum_apyrenoidigerum.ctg27174.p1  ORF type:complete len:467 (-),score=107.78 Plantae.Rhodophyta-Purpureofilum_apyrenoidigerum.ctg27174:137-1537(-)
MVAHVKVKREEANGAIEEDDENVKNDAGQTNGVKDASEGKGKGVNHENKTERGKLVLEKGQVDEDYYIAPICQVLKAKYPRPAVHPARMQDTRDLLGPDSQHAYVKNWVRMVEEEESGNVKFEVVKNYGPDCSEDALVKLLGLKNVFVKQLPNMPKPYVARLVFDRKHESVVLIKRGASDEDIVMGGCCYRPFVKQSFAEIAFLAISHLEQIRGYGTRLMAQTKTRAKELGLTTLLTCADNNAVPYFKKQGFSKKITLPPDLWKGYIKDYEGVTLMECRLHMKVDYLRIPMMIKAQKMCLTEKLKEVSNSHIVYPGLDAKKRKGMPIEEIPGYAEILNRKRSAKEAQNGEMQPPSVVNPDSEARKELQKHLQDVLNLLKNHNAAWPFLEPVDPKATGAFDYYDVIENPIDFRTIQERLDTGWYYLTKDIFKADVLRMVQNCYNYNGRQHCISDLAAQLEKYFLQRI